VAQGRIGLKFAKQVVFLLGIKFGSSSLLQRVKKCYRVSKNWTQDVDIWQLTSGNINSNIAFKL